MSRDKTNMSATNGRHHNRVVLKQTVKSVNGIVQLKNKSKSLLKDLFINEIYVMPSHDFIYNLSMRPAHGKVFMKIWLGFLSEYVMVCFFFDVQWIASYVICVCLRIVVSNTYCVVFLFCLSSSCVPYPMLPVSIYCPFLIAPSVFSNVYLLRYPNPREQNVQAQECICFCIINLFYLWHLKQRYKL